MRYLSVCSGIEAATVAWAGLMEPWAYAEVDRFPSAVLAHHYPHTPNLGDMTKFQEWPDADVDVLVGGTPCQSFSVAGLRAGLDDPRGALLLCYLAIARRYRPRWVVWENVPGVLSIDGGRAFGSLLGGLAELGYGFAYRVLDAQHFGLAQRRARVFVVGHLGDWRRAAAVLFERESLSGHPAPRREAGERVARPLTPGSPGGSGYRNDADTADNLVGAIINHDAGGMSNAQVEAGQLAAFGGNNTSGAIDVATAVNHHAGRYDFESETLLAFDARQSDVRQGMQVRRLTPRECERLQGFPDDYTLIPYRGNLAADGPRYKALGNSFAVPVVRWIGQRMAMVETIS